MWERVCFMPMQMFLADRADGVMGHFCIKRIRDDGCAEYYNKGEWLAFGEVFTEQQLINIILKGLSCTDLS